MWAVLERVTPAQKPIVRAHSGLSFAVEIGEGSRIGGSTSGVTMMQQSWTLGDIFTFSFKCQTQLNHHILQNFKTSESSPNTVSRFDWVTVITALQVGFIYVNELFIFPVTQPINSVATTSRQGVSLDEWIQRKSLPEVKLAQRIWH